MGLQVIGQVLTLFVLIALGVLCFKLKVATKETAAHFSSFVLKITLPCMILGSFLRPFSNELLAEAGTALLVALAVYAFAFLLAWIYPRVLGMKGPERGVHRYALIVPNSGFIGFPVVEAVMGSFYLFHAAIFNIPLWLLGFSIGLYLIAKEKGKSVSLSWKLFANPPFIAILAGFTLFFFSIPVPAPLEQGIRMLGAATTPLVMIITGITIAQADLKRIFGRWHIYATLFARLIFVPVLVALFCFLAGIRGNLMVLAVLLTAMPAASTTTVIAAVYDVAVEEASSLVVFSMLLSAATIPLILVFVHHIAG